MRALLAALPTGQPLAHFAAHDDDLAHAAGDYRLAVLVLACCGPRWGEMAPEELAFTSRKGAVLRNLNFRRDVFDRAARAAGPDGLTPHELRHTAASLAVSAGARVKSVQRMLGHSSAAMTLDVYSGLFDDDLDAVADRMDEAFTRNLADFSRTAAAVVALPTTGQGV